MAKYVIVKEQGLTGDIWVAYSTIFGLWGWATSIVDTLSIESAGECEQKLYNLKNRKPDPKKEVVKIVRI